MVKIRAYNASGEVVSRSGNTRSNSFTLGTRVLLTCDVTGLPEGSEVISYKWYHNCTRPMCEIQEGTPYYRVVDDCKRVIWGSYISPVSMHVHTLDYRNQLVYSSHAISISSNSILHYTNTIGYGHFPKHKSEP